jgi:hypothetical protein
MAAPKSFVYSGPALGGGWVVFAVSYSHFDKGNEVWKIDCESSPLSGGNRGAKTEPTRQGSRGILLFMDAQSSHLIWLYIAAIIHGRVYNCYSRMTIFENVVMW